MKKVISPFVRIIFLITAVIGLMLFIAEQLILGISLPLIWILTGKGIDEISDISFIIWLSNNKVFPIFEKLGIDKIL